MNIYYKIRQFFQPYWKPKPKLSKKDKAVVLQKKSDDVLKTIEKNRNLTMPVLVYPNPLTHAIKFKKKPSPNKIWYFHNHKYHQVFAHLLPNSGYQSKDRSGKNRRKLKPLIYPTNVGRFDRTHVLPIGYHGSENDERLVIGWDSDQNRKELNDFEQKQKKRNIPIYWFVNIEKTEYGARWQYSVYDVNTLSLLDELEVRMYAEFYWKK